MCVFLKINLIQLGLIVHSYQQASLIKQKNLIQNKNKTQNLPKRKFLFEKRLTVSDNQPNGGPPQSCAGSVSLGLRTAAALHTLYVVREPSPPGRWGRSPAPPSALRRGPRPCGRSVPKVKTGRYFVNKPKRHVIAISRANFGRGCRFIFRLCRLSRRFDLGCYRIVSLKS